MQESDANNKKIWSEAVRDIITELRVKTGKTPYKLSAECSMAKNTWYDVESGKCKDPAFSTIWKMAEAFDILPEDLVCKIRQKLGKNFSLSDLN